MTNNFAPKPQLVGLPVSEREAQPLPISQRTDDDLMLLARGGEQQAFETLVVRHQSRVLATACRILRNPALACDASQDTFIQLYKALHRYQARGCFRSYLYRILIRTCYRIKRARNKHQAVSLSLDPVSEAAGSLDIVLRRERRAELEQALTHLSKKTRSVVVLRFAADMTLSEIAATLRIPIGTVKSRLSSGLRKLEKFLAGEKS